MKEPGAVATDESMSAFRDLLLALADVFDAEGRSGGAETASAYRQAAGIGIQPTPASAYRLDDVIRSASHEARHPAAIAARNAHHLLPWSATGILDDQIPETVSGVFAVASIIGPDAMIKTDGIRSGLFVQAENAYYPLHAHAAEETYVMLAGEGIWTLGHNRPDTRVAGDYIFHPSFTAHATRTTGRPILAAWRWSGNIGRESYRMLEELGS